MTDIWTIFDDRNLRFAYRAGKHVKLTNWSGNDAQWPASNSLRAQINLLRKKYGQTPDQGRSIVKYGKAGSVPGAYHPRIDRARVNMRVDSRICDWYRDEKEAALAAARNLFVRLSDVFRFVEPAKLNGRTFGHELRHLLILACTEVESNLKAVLKANGAKPRRTNFDLIDYHRLVQPMRLANWEVRLPSYPKFGSSRPFANWRRNKAPTWWTAHNKAKHDRENELAKANLANVVHAMAALYVSIAAQFGAFVLHRDAAGTRIPVPLSVTQHGGPKWNPEEMYLPPKLKGGYSKWTPVPLFPDG